MSTRGVEFLQLLLKSGGAVASTPACEQAWSRLEAAGSAKERRNVIVEDFDLGPAKAERIIDQLGPFLVPLP